MLLNSFLFKQKARAALKGNWQTALVVTFFTGVFHTVSKVLERVTTADIRRVTDSITSALSVIPEGAELSVQQAGELSGFSDNSHFIRTFGNLTGTSPGRYAREYQSSDQIRMCEN